MYLTCTYIELDYIFRFWDIFQDVGLPVWYPDQGIKSVCWTLWADNSAICLGPLQPLCYVRSDGSLPNLSLSLSLCCVQCNMWITILYQSVTYTKYSIYSGIFAKKEVLFYIWWIFFFLLFFFIVFILIFFFSRKDFWESFFNSFSFEILYLKSFIYNYN